MYLAICSSGILYKLWHMVPLQLTANNEEGVETGKFKQFVTATVIIVLMSYVVSVTCNK